MKDLCFASYVLKAFKNYFNFFFTFHVILFIFWLFILLHSSYLLCVEKPYDWLKQNLEEEHESSSLWDHLNTKNIKMLIWFFSVHWHQSISGEDNSIFGVFFLTNHAPLTKSLYEGPKERRKTS